MQDISPCPNCSGENIYLVTTGVSGGGYAANYLPGLGGFLRHARLYPAVCRDCGLTRFFTDGDARSKLERSTKWRRQQVRTGT